MYLQWEMISKMSCDTCRISNDVRILILGIAEYSGCHSPTNRCIYVTVTFTLYRVLQTYTIVPRSQKLKITTKSLEQSPVFTARTHRHQNFQTQTKDLSFSAGLSLNLCSSISFVFILFYFSSRYVICWSILFCKRNSL